jgi:cellobiose transport system substrate-binding protein
MKWTRTRAAGALAVGTASALVLSACGSTPEPIDTVSHPPVTITFGYWGNFGIAESATGPSLESVYEATHPWVDLQLTSGSYTPQHDLLTQSLIQGTGAYTIAAIDEAYMSGFVAQSDNFVNLLDLGADQYQANYLPWKWDEAANADGSVVIGLGYDVNGLAMCYRKDLFEAAGLPSDRDAVSAAIGGGWDDFITLGEQYVAATGNQFIDNATNLLNPAVMQLGTGYAYYDRNDNLDMESIKPAFDIAINAIQADLSANIGTLTPAWDEGLTNGDFAAFACPAWILGYIENLATNNDFTGQWDVADLPGPGGNWGGSFYTIPKQGSEYAQTEAYAFIEWLIQPEQQYKILAETGRLPGQTALLESDAVQSLTYPFFDDVPYGTIFGQTAMDIPEPIYYAPKTSALRYALETVLNDVQAGKVPIDQAWDTALTVAEAANQ